MDRQRPQNAQNYGRRGDTKIEGEAKSDNRPGAARRGNRAQCVRKEALGYRVEWSLHLYGHGPSTVFFCPQSVLKGDGRCVRVTISTPKGMKSPAIRHPFYVSSPRRFRVGFL